MLEKMRDMVVDHMESKIFPGVTGGIIGLFVGFLIAYLLS
jgi:hypothetical protein